MRETNSHIYFWGSLYSQWFPCFFKHDGLTFRSAEQYMMYQKALLFNDKESADKIIKEANPKFQKALGRTVKNFDEKIWDQHKFNIVVQGNYLKFSQNEKLKTELLKTNKILVEASPYDRIWGIGLKWDDDKVLDEMNWLGENLLGKALMEVRAKLKFT